MLVSDFKDNISAALHGGSLNKVRNFEAAMQRAANTMLRKVDPIDTMRVAALTNTVHDDVYNYALPSDFRKMVDLYPQVGRNDNDKANRNLSQHFDVRKEYSKKTVAIEGSEGSKIIRINWRARKGTSVNELNSITDNGTWGAVATASNVETDTLNKVSGTGSVRFDVAATGDGIENITMSAVDLTTQDEVGDFFVWLYIPTAAGLADFNSATLIWGNDLTTNYWTGVAQTAQADGTAFKVGWNRIRVPWATATESGTVAPATTDSLRITFDVGAAISNLQVDNILCSLGRNFDLKYYSKYILKNTSGVWITKTASDDDTIVLDDDAIQIYILETIKQCAHQIEGKDSGFDLDWANS